MRTLDRWSWVGTIGFFLAACAWGVLEVHSSPDTWVGLAGGRQILEETDWLRFRETFPKLDTFSYPFYQEPWYNQNWLTHVGQYWVYDRLGPDALVYATWGLATCIFTLTLLATYWRTESWRAAFLAGSLVAIGGRDFLSARAATTGFFCIAALWALLCAIEGQRDRRRWWPIGLLLPLLWFWGNAHGSFLLAFGVLALYVGHWIAVHLLGRFVRAQNVATAGQVIAIAAVLVASVGLIAALGPYGVENFTHGEKVATSAWFRSVSEWETALENVNDAFPPMGRFWWLVGLSAAGVGTLWLAATLLGERSSRAAPPGPRLSALDVALVAIGLALTLWARRFAPILYTFAAPVLAVLTVRLAAPLEPRLRGWAGPALGLCALLAAAVTGAITWTTARRDLVEGFAHAPELGLLERVTRDDVMPQQAFAYLGENRLRVNLLTEWSEAGSVMFHVPTARVFIDPRAQQVYSEAHYQRYVWLVYSSPQDPETARVLRGAILAVLDASNTDAVLVWHSPTAIWDALLSSSSWTRELQAGEYWLFLRNGSAARERLAELARRGEKWLPSATATRGAAPGP